MLDRVVIKESEFVLTVIGYEFGPEGQNLYTLADDQGNRFTALYEDLTWIEPARVQNKYERLKMYVIVKDPAPYPVGLGVNALAHASFMAARTFKGEVFEDWINHSFRKVTCQVTPEQFDQCIAEYEMMGMGRDVGYVVFNENDWEDRDMAAAFMPRYRMPEIFRTLKLHSSEA